MHDGHDPEADRKELQGEGGGPPGGTRRVVLGFADAASHEPVDNQRENEGHECDGACGHDSIVWAWGFLFYKKKELNQ